MVNNRDEVAHEVAERLGYEIYKGVWWKEGQCVPYEVRDAFISSELRVKELETLLYDAIVELEYVQCVENCSSGLCASAKGASLVDEGMALLKVKDLSGETWARAVLSEGGKP